MLDPAGMLVRAGEACKREDFRRKMSLIHLPSSHEEATAAWRAARLRSRCEASELQGGGGRARRHADCNQPPDPAARGAVRLLVVSPAPATPGPDGKRGKIVSSLEGR